MTALRILIVAGEASGDLHGASLAKSLKAIRPDVEFSGMGGARMRAAGVETFFDIEKTGTVGVTEILGELPHYWDVYRTLTKKIRRRSFDAAILIDYPTLNLRLARHLKRADCPVHYFIGPQIWAWRKGRMKQIRRDVTRMHVILPFEEKLYRDAGVDAVFHGHPFVDLVRPSMDRDTAVKTLDLDPNRRTVALLPGSRKNEIHALLTVMVRAARIIGQQCPGCQFVLPLADSIDPGLVRPDIENAGTAIRLVHGKTYDVMHCADFAVIASGSATLEAGMLGCPMVILYRLNPLTYVLAKLLVKAEDFGLINIVAGERVVPELLQGEVTPENIAHHAITVLKDDNRRAALRKRLLAVRDSLGEPGVLSRIAGNIAAALPANREGG